MNKKTTALLFNFGTIICWSIAPVLIRYVKDSYSAVFQSFFRYSVSLIALWCICFLTIDKPVLRRNFKIIRGMIPKIILIALANYGFQIGYTYGFYLVYPGAGTLINQSGVIFSVLLAGLFFTDERKTMKRAMFWIGLAMALTGVVVTVVGGKEFGSFDFNVGVLMITFSSMAWALFSTLIRKWLGELKRIFAVSTIFSIVIPMFLITYLIVDGFTIPQAPAGTWLILITSGFVGIGIGHSFYYMALPVIGVATTSTLNLLIPFIVGLLSFLIYAETLTVFQIVGGIVLITGAFIVTRARFRHIENKGEKS